MQFSDADPQRANYDRADGSVGCLMDPIPCRWIRSEGLICLLSDDPRTWTDEGRKEERKEGSSYRREIRAKTGGTDFFTRRYSCEQ